MTGAEAVLAAADCAEAAFFSRSKSGDSATFTRISQPTISSTLLWSAPDHGYLTTYAAHALLSGEAAIGKPLKAGHLGTFTPKADGDSMSIGLPVMVFDKDNVDKFNF